jgi:putative transposase
LILEKQEAYGDAVMEIAGMADPVHLLLDVDSARLGIDAVVGKIQGYTAPTICQAYRWMKSRVPSRWRRWWCIAAVGAVSLEGVQQDSEE